MPFGLLGGLLPKLNYKLGSSGSSASDDEPPDLLYRDLNRDYLKWKGDQVDAGNWREPQQRDPNDDWLNNLFKDYPEPTKKPPPEAPKASKVAQLTGTERPTTAKKAATPPQDRTPTLDDYRTELGLSDDVPEDRELLQNIGVELGLMGRRRTPTNAEKAAAEKAAKSKALTETTPPPTADTGLTGLGRKLRSLLPDQLYTPSTPSAAPPPTPTGPTPAAGRGTGYTPTKIPLPTAAKEPLPQKTPAYTDPYQVGVKTPATSKLPVDRGPETTPLAPAQEQQFRQWARDNGVKDVDHPESHYDYRGYWKDIASKGADQTKQYPDGPHFPDTYKQHGHPTFSVESKYSTGPTDGGKWEGEKFIPGKPKKPPIGAKDYLQSLYTYDQPLMLPMGGSMVTIPGAPSPTLEAAKLVPFAGSVASAAEVTMLITAAKRIRDDKATPADLQLFQDYAAKEQDAKERGYSWGYNVAQIAMNIPAFAGEMAATEGAFTAARGMARTAVRDVATDVAAKWFDEAAKKAVRRKGVQIAADVAGTVAGGAAQTLAIPTRLGAAVAQNMKPPLQRQLTPQEQQDYTKAETAITIRKREAEALHAEYDALQPKVAPTMAALDRGEAELKQMGAAIDAARAHLDRSSQASVDAFNAKVTAFQQRQAQQRQLQQSPELARSNAIAHRLDGIRDVLKPHLDVMDRLDKKTLKDTLKNDWDDDFWPAVAKAIPDQFIEVFTEHTGGAIAPLEKALGKAVGKMIPGEISGLKAAVLNNWMRLNPDNTVAEFSRRLAQGAAWHGIIGESFEERLGELMRAPINDWLNPGQPQPAMIRMVTGGQGPGPESDNPRWQATKDLGYQLTQEGAAFATIPGLSTLLDATGGAIEKRAEGKRGIANLQEYRDSLIRTYDKVNQFDVPELRQQTAERITVVEQMLGQMGGDFTPFTPPPPPVPETPTGPPAFQERGMTGQARENLGSRPQPFTPPAQAPAGEAPAPGEAPPTEEAPIPRGPDAGPALLQAAQAAGIEPAQAQQLIDRVQQTADRNSVPMAVVQGQLGVQVVPETEVPRLAQGTRVLGVIEPAPQAPVRNAMVDAGIPVERAQPFIDRAQDTANRAGEPMAVVAGQLGIQLVRQADVPRLAEGTRVLGLVHPDPNYVAPPEPVAPPQSRPAVSQPIAAQPGAAPGVPPTGAPTAAAPGGESFIDTQIGAGNVPPPVAPTGAVPPVPTGIGTAGTGEVPPAVLPTGEIPTGVPPTGEAPGAPPTGETPAGMTDEDLVNQLAALAASGGEQGPQWKTTSPYSDQDVDAVLTETKDAQTQRRIQMAQLEEQIAAAEPGSPEHNALVHRLQQLQDTYDNTWQFIDEHIDNVDVRELDLDAEDAATRWMEREAAERKAAEPPPEEPPPEGGEPGGGGEPGTPPAEPAAAAGGVGTGGETAGETGREEQEQVGEGGKAQAAPEVITFRSGNQRAIADVRGYMQAGQDIGVTALGMTKPVMDAIIEHVRNGGSAFIDSGAFGRTKIVDGKGVAGINMAAVISRYHQLADAVGDEVRGLYVVAPDVPPAFVSPTNRDVIVPRKKGVPRSFPDETAALQERYAAQIDELIARALKVIIPVQVGPSMTARAIEVVQRWPEALIGLPGNQGPISKEQFEAMLRGMAEAGAEPYGFHFLGLGNVGRAEKRLNQLVGMVHAQFPDAIVSSDATRTTAIIGKGRLIDTDELRAKVEAAAHKEIGKEWEGPALSVARDFFAGHWSLFTDKELTRLFTALAGQDEDVEATRKGAIEALNNGELPYYVQEIGGEDALFREFWKIAIDESRKTQGPKLRTEAIAEADKKTEPPVSQPPQPRKIEPKDRPAWQMTVEEWLKDPRSQRTGGILASSLEDIISGKAFRREKGARQQANVAKGRSKTELKALAWVLGIPKGGTAVQLQEKIKRAAAARLALGEAVGDITDAKAQVQKLMDGFTKEQLFGFAKDIGANVFKAGGKESFATGIVNHLNQVSADATKRVGQATHYRAVARAIENEEQVPEHVLAAYPDLVNVQQGGETAGGKFRPFVEMSVEDLRDEFTKWRKKGKNRSPAENVRTERVLRELAVRAGLAVKDAIRGYGDALEVLHSINYISVFPMGGSRAQLIPALQDMIARIDGELANPVSDANRELLQKNRAIYDADLKFYESGQPGAPPSYDAHLKTMRERLGVDSAKVKAKRILDLQVHWKQQKRVLAQMGGKDPFLEAHIEDTAKTLDKLELELGDWQAAMEGKPSKFTEIAYQVQALEPGGVVTNHGPVVKTQRAAWDILDALPKLEKGGTYRITSIEAPKETDTKRATRKDGRLVPQSGDRVYQTVRGFGGAPAQILGEVIEGKKGELRVRVTGSASIVGQTSDARKTFPLDETWTVVDDPEVERRRAAREKKEKAEQEKRDREEADYQAGARRKAAEAIAGGHEPLTRETPVGSKVVNHFTGETDTVSDQDPQWGPVLDGATIGSEDPGTGAYGGYSVIPAEKPKAEEGPKAPPPSRPAVSQPTQAAAPSQSDLLSEATEFIGEMQGSRNPAKSADEAWQRYQDNMGASRGTVTLDERAFKDAWAQMQPAAPPAAPPAPAPVGVGTTTNANNIPVGARVQVETQEGAKLDGTVVAGEGGKHDVMLDSTGQVLSPIGGVQAMVTAMPLEQPQPAPLTDIEKKRQEILKKKAELLKNIGRIGTGTMADPVILGQIIELAKMYVELGILTFRDAALQFRQDWIETYGAADPKADGIFELAWPVLQAEKEGLSRPEAIAKVSVMKNRPKVETEIRLYNREKAKQAKEGARGQTSGQVAAGPGPAAEPEGATAEPVRGGSEGPLGALPAGAGATAEGAGAAGAGPGGAEPGAPGALPGGPDAGTQPQAPSGPGEGAVPGPGVPAAGGVSGSTGATIPPAGATGGGVAGPVGIRGDKPPDYVITAQRIAGIINRGPVERFRDNVAAIRLLKELVANHRYALPIEQNLLAKYVGWGATEMAMYLEERPRTTWSKNEKALWEELRSLTTEEERKNLIRSAPNAHFTYDLYVPIWKALQWFGFKGGRILEPAVGIGHALGFMPTEIRGNSRIVASELDPTTAAMAGHLYPSARIQATGFEKIRLPRNTQDIAVSNVPFGKGFKVEDNLFTGALSFITEKIHSYFFAKALEMVRPGGYVVFITSRSTMDGPEHADIRRHLMDKAHFVGAVRLPGGKNGAFVKSAKTQVVADLVILQKKDPNEKFVDTDKALVEMLAKDRKDKADLFRRSNLSEALSSGDRNVYRSAYWDAHPEHVLGTEDLSGTMNGRSDYNVTARDEANLGDDLYQALQKILPQDGYKAATTTSTEPEAVIDPDQVKPGELRRGEANTITRVHYDGSVVDATPRQEDGSPHLREVDRIGGMIDVRDARRAVVETMQSPHATTEQIKEAQGAMLRAYNKFYEEFGRLTDPDNSAAFEADPEASSLIALENVKTTARVVTQKSGKKKLVVDQEFNGLADIFTKRTIRATPVVTQVDSPQDALLASLGKYGRLDWQYMAKISGFALAAPIRVQTLQSVLKTDGLVFEQPDGTWVTTDEYLSGDVVTKLDEALMAAEAEPERFATNASALLQVQPTPKEAKDVSVALGVHWVEPKDVAQFVTDTLEEAGTEIKLIGTEQYIRWMGEYPDNVVRAARRHALTVPFGNPARREPLYFDFTRLLDAALNLRFPVASYTIKGPDGKPITIRQEKETLAIRANIEEVRLLWLKWVYGNRPVLDRTVATYNQRFNRTVERGYDGSHLANYVDPKTGKQVLDDKGLPLGPADGMVRSSSLAGLELPFSLYPHQLRAVWRALSTGNTYLAHEVGAGKTFEMIIAAMEMRRTGRARKPMISVPTHLMPQWRRDIMKAYPTAKLLAFEDADLNGKQRQVAMNRIAHGDWDMVLIPHKSLEKLSVSKARMAATLQEWIDEITAAEAAARAAAGAKDPSVKKLEQARRTVEAKVLKLKARIGEGKDDNLYWEHLGVDALLIDEAHAFKNLYYFSKLGREARGLNRADSNRALDMWIKVKEINESSNYRNLVFATATPVMNTLAEVYTLQRYLQPHRLRQLGFENFDNWYATFAEAKPVTEQRPDGSYHEVLRVSKFRNGKLLHRISSEVLDYVTWGDMPYLNLPKLKDDKGEEKIQHVVGDPHPQYQVVRDWFKKRLATLKANPPYYNQQTGEYRAPDRFHPITGERIMSKNPKTPGPAKDNILVVMNDARLAAVDLRLVLGDHVTDTPGSRLQLVSDRLADFYKREADNKGAALVFLDVGIPKTFEPLEFLGGAEIEDKTRGKATGFEEEERQKEEGEDDDDAPRLSPDETNGNFDMYNALKQELIKRGLKSSEIAFVHQAKNVFEKMALYDAVNRGDVRVLITSTEKGATGMNVQERLGMLVEFDAPMAMRPGDVRQRFGRIYRNGNTYSQIEVLRFLTKDTTDEWLYGMLGTKQDMITAFMKGNLDEWEDPDPQNKGLEDAEILSSNNPKKIRLLELKSQLPRVAAQAAAAEQAVQQARGDAARSQTMIERGLEASARLETWITAHFRKLAGDDFTIQVGEDRYTNRTDANAALIDALKPLVERLRAQPYKEGSNLTTLPEEQVGEYGSTPVAVHERPTTGLPIVVQAVKSKSYGDKGQPIDLIRLTLNLDVTPAGEQPMFIGTLDAPTGSLESFGEGRNLITSIVDRYNSLETRLEQHKNNLVYYREELARAEKLIASASEAPDKYRNMRAEIEEIERELLRDSQAQAPADQAAPRAPRSRTPADRGQSPADVAPASIGSPEADALLAGLTADLSAEGDSLEGEAADDVGDVEASIRFEDDDQAGGGEGGTGSVPGVSSQTAAQLAPPTAPVLNLPKTAADVEGVATPINPIEFPELVWLAKAITGADPKLLKKTAFGKGIIRGRFSSGMFGQAFVEMNRDLFKRGNEAQLAATIAHEIGHAVDWFGDLLTFDRGSLLGHIKSLHQFLSGQYTDPRGNTIKDVEIRRELQQLSMLWRPWDRKTADTSFKRYRDSNIELYADALSAILTNPGIAKQVAPKFMQQFFDHLDQKQEVKDALFDVWQVLAGTREELIDRRRAGTQGFFKWADMKSVDIMEQNLREQAQNRYDPTKRAIELMANHVDIHAPWLWLLQDKPVSTSEQNPYYALSERSYRLGGLVKVFLERDIQPILQALEQHKISLEDMGEVLKYERIIAGDRGELANPGGETPESSKEAMDRIGERLNHDRMRVLLKASADFRQAVKDVFREGYYGGLYSKKTWNKINQNDYYATFRSVLHLDEPMTSGIIKQFGMLENIANPFDQTLMKAIVTIRATEFNVVKTKAFKYLETYHPTEALDADTVKRFVITGEVKDPTTGRTTKTGIWIDEPIPPRGKKAALGLKLITYKVDGKLKGKYVDKYIANSLEDNRLELNDMVVDTLVFANNILRGTLTTYNVGFQPYNVIRDFTRTWKNAEMKSQAPILLRSIAVGLRLLKLYGQSVPLAAMRAYGPASPDIGRVRRGARWLQGKRGQFLTAPTAKEQARLQELWAAQEAGILAIEQHRPRTPNDLVDSMLGNILKEYGVAFFERTRQHYAPAWMPKKYHGQYLDMRRKVLPVAGPAFALLKSPLDLMDGINRFIETLPKAAMLYELTGTGTIGDLTAERRHYIRTKVGTPDVMAGGYFKPIENQVLLFSNIAIQGLRSDYQAATQPTTRSGFWWKTALITLVPKAAMVAAEAAANGLAPGGGPDPKANKLQAMLAKVPGLAAWGRSLKRASKYNRANKVVVPLHDTPEGNSVLLLLPQDDTGRILGGLFYKILNGAVNGEDTSTWSYLSDIVAYWTAQFPSASPAISAAADVVQYASGGNVHDPFRQKDLFTEREMKARKAKEGDDNAALKKFIGWQFQQVGAGMAWRFYAGDEQPEIKTKGQQILDKWFVTGTAGRFLQITNYGETEALREKAAVIEGGLAARQGAEQRAVNQKIAEYNRLPPGEKTLGKQRQLAVELQRELYPNPKSKDERDEQFQRLERRVRLSVVRGQADALGDALLSASTNAAKVELLMEGTKGMTPEAADQYALEALRQKVIPTQVLLDYRKRVQGLQPAVGQ